MAIISHCDVFRLLAVNMIIHCLRFMFSVVSTFDFCFLQSKMLWLHVINIVYLGVVRNTFDFIVCFKREFQSIFYMISFYFSGFYFK